MMPELVRIKVSAASARLPFNGCEPTYIRDVCHAKCCDAPGRPTGTLITIHPSEQSRIEAMGAVVQDGLLQPREGERKCPFKTLDHLCGIHFEKGEPFGCIASPFTLNTNDTLIVRNRYKLLPCYNDGPRTPAYRAFAESLVLILGADQARQVTAHLNDGGGDVSVMIRRTTWQMLRENDAIKHAAG
jgi:hypothetical protein